MKSFYESLQITKNMNLMKECLYLMEENNINPVKFVEWFTTEGCLLENDLLLEASEAALTTWQDKNDRINYADNLPRTFQDSYGQRSYHYEGKPTPTSSTNHTVASLAGDLAQNVGQKVGQFQQNFARFGKNAKEFGGGLRDKWHKGLGDPDWYREAGTAEQALNMLSKRLGVSSELSQKLGGPQFSSTILSMIEMLRNKQWDKMKNAPQNNDEYKPEISLAYSDYRPENFKKSLEHNLTILQQAGIDPIQFVEEYSQIIMLNEGWWDNTKNALGNFWHNATGRLQRWANGDQQQNWGWDAKERDRKKDLEAVNNAFTALKNLDGKVSGEFAKSLNSVVKQLDPQQNYSLKSLWSSTQQQTQQRVQQTTTNPTPNQPKPTPTPQHYSNNV